MPDYRLGNISDLKTRHDFRRAAHATYYSVIGFCIDNVLAPSLRDSETNFWNPISPRSSAGLTNSAPPARLYGHYFYSPQ